MVIMVVINISLHFSASSTVVHRTAPAGKTMRRSWQRARRQPIRQTGRPVLGRGLLGAYWASGAVNGGTGSGTSAPHLSLGCSANSRCAAVQFPLCHPAATAEGLGCGVTHKKYDIIK